MAVISGLAIGILGGMIGLGGAEFRLPLLIGLFGFVALEAVIVNKATSLIVVSSALIFRTAAVPIQLILEHWEIIANLLTGSLIGAWLGASVATKLASKTLYKVIAILLVLIAILLAVGHGSATPHDPIASGVTLIIIGIVAGVAIGAAASLLGVAGGEFLIPTLVLLFSVDVKLAGSLSLAISLPTMLVGFARYSRDRSFTVLARNKTFVTLLALGSIVGAFLGARLLLIVPSEALLPTLAVILLFSAINIWRHD